MNLVSQESYTSKAFATLTKNQTLRAGRPALIGFR